MCTWPRDSPHHPDWTLEIYSLKKMIEWVSRLGDTRPSTRQGCLIRKKGTLAYILNVEIPNFIYFLHLHVVFCFCFFFLRIIALQYCVVSTIHQHESSRVFTSWATMEALNQPQVSICPLPPERPFPSPSPSHLSKLSQSTVLSSHVTQQIPTFYLFYIW